MEQRNCINIQAIPIYILKVVGINTRPQVELRIAKAKRLGTQRKSEDALMLKEVIRREAERGGGGTS